MTKTICLNMIVKNEATIIEDTLANILDNISIDYWVIVDTGSTDDTMVKIRHFFEQHKIPGELYQDVWVNFGYNRNLAYNRCRGKADYVFFFDADDRFYGRCQLPEKLIADAYLIPMRLGESDMFYTRPLLVANRQEFRWRGIIHEFFDVNIRGVHLVSLSDKDFHVNSGKFGARSQLPGKSQRDAMTLEEAYFNPDEEVLKPRYALNCAKANHMAGNLVKAIEWFERALGLALSDDEHLQALCQLGTVYEIVGQEDKAFNAYARAQRFSPGRLEGYYYMLCLFKKQERIQEAYNIARQIREVSLPKTPTFIGRRDIYTYLFTYEVAQVAVQVKDFALLNRASQKLLVSNDVPGQLKLEVLKQLLLFRNDWHGLKRHELNRLKQYFFSFSLFLEVIEDDDPLELIDRLLQEKPIKRILFLHPFMMVGGVETVLSNYLDLLTRDGHYEADLLLAEYVTRDRYQALPKQIKTESLLTRIESEFLTLAHNKITDPTVSPEDKSYYQSWYFGIKTELNQRLQAKLIQGNYDLVIDFKDSFLSHFFESLEEIDLPIVYWIHSNDYFDRWRGYKETYQAIFRKASALIAICEDMAEQADRTFDELGLGSDKPMLTTLYNPLDIAKINQQMSERVNSEEAELLRVPFMIAVSRLYDPQKNLTELIDLYQKLKAHGVREKLYILGDGPSAPLLEAKIKSMGLEKDCLLLGNKLNPYPFMAAARLFLHTAHYEGLPTVLMESMACRTPVVAYDCPTGPREILKDGDLGALVPLYNQEAFVSEVLRLLSHPNQVQTNDAYHSLWRFDPNQVLVGLADLLALL